MGLTFYTKKMSFWLRTVQSRRITNLKLELLPVGGMPSVRLAVGDFQAPYPSGRREEGHHSSKNLLYNLQGTS